MSGTVYDTVLLMTVGTFPVTRACSVPQTSPLVTVTGVCTIGKSRWSEGIRS